MQGQNLVVDNSNGPQASFSLGIPLSHLDAYITAENVEWDPPFPKKFHCNWPSFGSDDSFEHMFDSTTSSYSQTPFFRPIVGMRDVWSEWDMTTWYGEETIDPGLIDSSIWTRAG